MDHIILFFGGITYLLFGFSFVLVFFFNILFGFLYYCLDQNLSMNLLTEFWCFNFLNH